MRTELINAPQIYLPNGYGTSLIYSLQFLWIDKRQPTKENYIHKPHFSSVQSSVNLTESRRFLAGVVWCMHMAHLSILFCVPRWRKSVRVSAELILVGKNDNANDKAEEEDRKKIKEKLHRDENERAHYLNASYCLRFFSFWISLLSRA